jgi:hypothetical protein
MAEELFVDVTYRGLELGRGLKLAEIGPSTAFLHHATPMPVGAVLELHDEDGTTIPVRVSRIWEQTANAERDPGMRVVVEALSGPAKDWWEARVSSDDPAPAILPQPEPEPEPEPVAEPEPEPVAEAKPKKGRRRRKSSAPPPTGEAAPQAEDTKAKKRKRSRKKKKS